MTSPRARPTTSDGHAPAWDVAVAGAGPAGAVAAMVLARAGRHVILLDPCPPAVDGRRVGESLPGAARPLLGDLGLLERVEQGSHLHSYGNMSAWGSQELHGIDSLRDPHGPGWHLDRVGFDGALRVAAREAGATHWPSRVRAVERVGEVWQLDLKGSPSRAPEPTRPRVSARWIVDATGRSASVARCLGVERQRDDRLVALYAWTTPGASQDTRTLVESVPQGWWYTAALPDGGRVVVLHVDGEHAASILGTKGAWAQRLAETTHVRRALGETELATTPRATEAGGARLARFAGPGWLAVGDAALSFDPISSQGMLDALYTGLRGAQAIHVALGADDAPVSRYAERLESIRAAYLRHHKVFYATERRWLEQPFWSRRVVGAAGHRPHPCLRSRLGTG